MWKFNLKFLFLFIDIVPFRLSIYFCVSFVSLCFPGIYYFILVAEFIGIKLFITFNYYSFYICITFSDAISNILNICFFPDWSSYRFINYINLFKKLLFHWFFLLFSAFLINFFSNLIISFILFNLNLICSFVLASRYRIWSHCIETILLYWYRNFSARN